MLSGSRPCREIRKSTARFAKRTRHSYFLLVAAGGGIAIASSQTRGAVLARANVALELAVVAWAVSFFCGCRYVDFVLSEFYLDHQSERVQS